MREQVESDVADLGVRGRIGGPAHPVAAGRLQRATRSGGATQAQDGQVVVAVDVLHDERGAARLVTKGYDARGLLTSEAYPSGANLTLTRTWNDIGALSSVTDGTNTIASMAYVGFRLKTVTFGNTTTQTNAWTGFREEVETVHHKNSGGTTLLRLDYGYDKVHTRTFERYGASGSSGDGFAYDKAQRLTTAWMGSSTPSSPSSAAYVTKLDFNMDDDGNRTSVVTTPYQQSATTVSYTSNALNQYTAVGGTSWTHDANGNVTNNGTLKFEYDYRNQIVRVKNASSNAVVATYRYDALGHFQYTQTQKEALSPEAVEARFIRYQALGDAIRLNKRVVVLIDEIDKAPRDLPNDVLAALEKLQFFVPETGMSYQSAQENRPVIIMTSNSEKNLPDAFLRRVAYYHIPFPDTATLLRIVQSKVDGYGDSDLGALIAFFETIRGGRSVKLRKNPATAELILWAALLRRLDFPAEKLRNPDSLNDAERELLELSFSVLAKNREDLEGLKRV